MFLRACSRSVLFCYRRILKPLIWFSSAAYVAPGRLFSESWVGCLLDSISLVIYEGDTYGYSDAIFYSV